MPSIWRQESPKFWVRSVLIHDYMGVDLEAVWQFTQQNIPGLKKDIQDILMESENNEQFKF
ncbi:MAG: DUF86 domain-containing protein [Deltaproteobacteria bacterium]|nr:DUF86 domain-containing protein [Deltaproteobacteria bacterium]